VAPGRPHRLVIMLRNLRPADHPGTLISGQPDSQAVLTEASTDTGVCGSVDGSPVGRERWPGGLQHRSVPTPALVNGDGRLRQDSLIPKSRDCIAMIVTRRDLKSNDLFFGNISAISADAAFLASVCSRRCLGFVQTYCSCMPPLAAFRGF
jgi:hypothetical protein